MHNHLLNKLDSQMKKPVPSSLKEAKKWEVGSWTLTLKGDIFVKVKESGEQAHISSYFQIISQNNEIKGFTRGLTLRGKNLF